MRKLVLFLIGILFLTTGCTKKLTCTKEKKEDFVTVKEVFLVHYKNDIVDDIQIDLQATLKKDYDDYTETIEKNLRSQFDKYNNVKGISIDSSNNDNIAKVHLYIQLDKMKKKDKENLNFINLNEAYSQLKNTMKKKGYHCD